MYINFNSATLSYINNVRNGASGDYKIEDFEFSEKDISKYKINLEKFNIKNGKKLIYKNNVMISNTLAEIESCLEVIDKVFGTVLIAGLGLEISPFVIAEKENVNSVIVIEHSKDIITLTGSFLKNPKIKIINADIFKWENKENLKIDCIWFDIWNEINSKNLKEMNFLKNKFKDIPIRLCWSENS